MGASRKLQGEIDRVLKKVQEGVDVFDSIWNKVYDTENANQKEKFEADLKKEIKKLQRYRDQIKTWIQSSEIKDKKALMDARKQIEREMERFKVCEKETKTKAFSKEGLGQQPKTDPREKAKSETRDWLNNFVSDLENQIDTFEAEIEGLSIKKGKNRPPRLTHLEESITRHKAHIKKLESILRLLDNDELSPEQVNDVRDFIEDYVDRNQDNFEEFSDVEDVYSTLPMEKVEALEDMVSSLGPSTLAKGAASISTVKNSIPINSIQVSIPSDSVEDTAASASPSQEANSETAPRTPPAKTGQSSSPVHASSPLPSPSPVQINASPKGVSTGPAFSRSISDSVSNPTPAVPVPVPVNSKEEDGKPNPAVAKPAPPGLTLTQSPVSGLMAPTTIVPLKTVPTAAGGDNSNSSSQPLGSPMAGNRAVLQQGGKSDVVGSDVAGSGAADGVANGGLRGFVPLPPAVVSSAQWRPPTLMFPPPSETVQQLRRAEIAPDQREQYVQRLQQVQQAAKQQQQQQNVVTMPQNITSAANQKPTSFPANSQSQQNLLMQQANYYQGLPYRPFVAQTLSNSAAQAGPGVAIQVQASAENAHSKTEEQPTQQSIADDISPKSATNSKISEEDLKSPRPKSVMSRDTSKNNSKNKSTNSLTGIWGSSMNEGATGQLSDMSPGQPLQSTNNNVAPPPANLGVIGRRSAMSAPPEDTFDPVNALQLLEAAFYKLPQAKDSERAKTYVPRHPVVTPASFPQIQSPTVSNPALWERLAYDSLGTDTLFFAFYYQQGTQQQYLAARELKKNSWRYHRKYNTWFQRHEEPKVTTDEFEKGSYVYFDFHVTDDASGWCQRVKNEFVFEYNFLEDELAV